MPRQRGAIIRRGTTFSVKYRTPAGKQKWESGFANRSQAQQRLNQVLGEITHGSYVEPKATKFEKFANEWMDGRVGVRGSTLSSYGSIVRKQLIPYFGKMSLSDIGLRCGMGAGWPVHRFHIRSPRVGGSVPRQRGWQRVDAAYFRCRI